MGWWCDLRSCLLLLLLIDTSAFAILSTIEALSQTLLVVGIIDRMWHRQRCRCLQGLSRLCRRLKPGKIHGSKLFTHARSRLAVFLIRLPIAILHQDFIQCRIHGVFQGGHVHRIHTNRAVQNRSRGDCRLARQRRRRSMRREGSQRMRRGQNRRRMQRAW